MEHGQNYIRTGGSIYGCGTCRTEYHSFADLQMHLETCQPEAMTEPALTHLEWWGSGRAGDVLGDVKAAAEQQYRDAVDQQRREESAECEICGRTGPNITRIVKRLMDGRELVTCDDVEACVRRAQEAAK